MKGGITLTIIFEASAVNRDESIGGNVQSIKKLRRKDGVHSFFSRAFLRHKIFNTLVNKYGWKESTLSKDGDVIQFNIENESIITSEELDFFGYMSTKDETAVRKAPVGMTKAISLETWEGDMAFYANHDLVARARKAGIDANPNPYSKEEHVSLYKYSVILDLSRLGRDVVYVKENQKKIFGVNLKDGTILDLKNGKIEIKKIDKIYEIECEVNEDVEKERIKQFLDVVINGFPLHSSTEDWTTTPLFAIAGYTKIPLVVFDPYVRLNGENIDTELLKKGLHNSHVEKTWIYPGMFKIEDLSEKANIVETLEDLYNEIIKHLDGEEA